MELGPDRSPSATACQIKSQLRHVNGKVGCVSDRPTQARDEPGRSIKKRSQTGAKIERDGKVVVDCLGIPAWFDRAAALADFSRSRGTYALTLAADQSLGYDSYAMRNCATDARASPPLMSGTILSSSAVTPARSTA